MPTPLTARNAQATKPKLPGKRWIGCGWDALLTVGLVAAPAAALAADAQSFMRTADVAGEQLHLNGSGSRYKALFRVCDVALYAQRAVGSERDLLALPGAKRLHLVAARDIGRRELIRLLTPDLAGKPTAAAQASGLAHIAARLETVTSLKRGDSLGVDFVPGRGTTLLLNGDPLGPPHPDALLFAALVQPWLGAQAIDASLRQALLGARAAAARN